MALGEEELFQYIRDELGADVAALSAQSRLFSQGVIDSFALVSLMTFIERQCSIRIRPDEVTLDNFDSVDRILDFIRRKAQD